MDTFRVILYEVSDRQRDGKDNPASVFLIPYADRSAVLLDDAVTDEKAQSGAIRFGAKERIKNAFDVLWSNRGSGTGQGQGDRFSIGASRVKSTHILT